jgi:hypothetical protein
VGSSTGTVAVVVIPAGGAGHAVSGRVVGAVAGGVTLSLRGGATLTAVTDVMGAFAFAGVADGSYTVDASRSGYAITPGTASVNVSGRDVRIPDFRAVTSGPGPEEDAIDPFLGTPATGAVATIPVIIIRFLPTADGANLDVVKATDYWSPGPISLADLKRNIDAYTVRGKFMLEEGSKFRGYNDPTAPPYLGYQVVKSWTVYEQVPFSRTFFLGYPVGGFQVPFPDFFAIADRFDFRHYVEDLGVKEIWLWYGQSAMPGYPCYDPSIHRPENFVEFIESNMASPTTSDISNSYRTADLPVFNKTYVLYSYNFRRTQAEMVHNHGHQLEAIYSYAAQAQDGSDNLFVRDFAGWGAGHSSPPLGRSGDTHHPPNTTVDYDYLNPAVVQSDIEDWRPDGLGARTGVSIATWENLSYAWPTTSITLLQKTESQWYIYWMQSMPGFHNTIPYGSSTMTNWWQFTDDWDASIRGGVGLHR